MKKWLKDLPIWLALLAIVLVLAGMDLLHPWPKGQPVVQVKTTQTPTAAPSRTPQPQSTATQASLIVTATPLGTVVATNIPLPLSTPKAEAQAYRLKPWTEPDALQALNEASTANLFGGYDYDRSFYQESLLYEALLRFPELRSDPDLNNGLLELKRDISFSGYAYVHDHSVQPLANQIETGLHQGQIKFSVDSLSTWLKPKQIDIRNQSAVVDNLFDDHSPAMVLQLGQGPTLAMFVIRQIQPGAYSVIPLYPGWRNFNWGQETFQVLDLNGDGRAEIAISDDYEGTGISHFCQKSLAVYEWDGNAFRDLMENDQVEHADVGGACMGPSFIPGQNGTMVIEVETDLPTHCDNQFYTERTLYYWDGKAFKGAKPQPLTPADNGLDMCAISWAATAGPQNSRAVQILAAALWPWPQDAVNEWGPASRDYFSLKLASWYLRLGRLNQGLELLQSIASAPHTPSYPIPARVANTFLQAYAAGGMYQAVQAVSAFYNRELNAISACAEWGCDTKKISSQWGFAESEWQADGLVIRRFINDFDAIDAMTLSLQADRPENLAEFIRWLDRNQINYRELQQGDVDGDGTSDWLVDITDPSNTSDDATCQCLQYSNLYAFLRSDKSIQPVLVDYILLSNGMTTRWHSFRPVPGTDMVNVFQLGQSLFTFRIHKTDSNYSIIEDLPSHAQSGEDGPPVNSWDIIDTPQGQALVVQYIAAATGTYIWDSAQGKLVPSGLSPDLQEQHIGQIEQALYVDNDPAKALPLLDGLLGQTTIENYDQDGSAGSTIVPRLRPYLLYLRGLAYELSGDPKDAIGDYWQLWHDYPADPFALIAQRKLEPDN